MNRHLNTRVGTLVASLPLAALVVALAVALGACGPRDTTTEPVGEQPAKAAASEKGETSGAESEQGSEAAPTNGGEPHTTADADATGESGGGVGGGPSTAAHASDTSGSPVVRAYASILDDADGQAVPVPRVLARGGHGGVPLLPAGHDGRWCPRAAAEHRRPRGWPHALHRQMRYRRLLGPHERATAGRQSPVGPDYRDVDDREPLGKMESVDVADASGLPGEHDYESHLFFVDIDEGSGYVVDYVVESQMGRTISLGTPDGLGNGLYALLFTDPTIPEAQSELASVIGALPDGRELYLYNDTNGSLSVTLR